MEDAAIDSVVNNPRNEISRSRGVDLAISPRGLRSTHGPPTVDRAIELAVASSHRTFFTSIYISISLCLCLPLSIFIVCLSPGYQGNSIPSLCQNFPVSSIVFPITTFQSFSAASTGSTASGMFLIFCRQSANSAANETVINSSLPL